MERLFARRPLRSKGPTIDRLQNRGKTGPKSGRWRQDFRKFSERSILQTRAQKVRFLGWRSIVSLVAITQVRTTAIGGYYAQVRSKLGYGDADRSTPTD